MSKDPTIIRNHEAAEHEFLHNRHTENVPDIYKCQRCVYEGNSEEQLNAHLLIWHRLVKCDKCDYTAEDMDCMRNHMMKHTGRFVFPCGQCEFEATKQSLLERHIQHKHTAEKKERKNKYECILCTKSFPDEVQRRNHKCAPLKYSYPCETCNFTAASADEHLKHIGVAHVRDSYSCSYCEFETKHEKLLKSHIVKQLCNHNNKLHGN